jgi:type II secretion system protein I
METIYRPNSGKYIANIRSRCGFALIEILIAITILSISLIGITSAVSGGIIAISQNKNLTIAMIIAKNKLNEFEMSNMRGLDINNEQVKEYPGFTFSRTVKRFEHILFGPLDANRIEISVKWQEKERDKLYTISYIYPSK